jgi:hypothetical protein
MRSSSVERHPGSHSILPKKLLSEYMNDQIKTWSIDITALSCIPGLFF